jgi:hypothetical protein
MTGIERRIDIVELIDREELRQTAAVRQSSRPARTSESQ